MEGYFYSWLWNSFNEERSKPRTACRTFSFPLSPAVTALPGVSPRKLQLAPHHHDGPLLIQCDTDSVVQIPRNFRYSISMTIFVVDIDTAILSQQNIELRRSWKYGVHLFVSAKKSNLNKIQVFQSKLLRLITGAPAYVNNRILHLDLNTISKGLYTDNFTTTHSTTRTH
jgi:hypothetical protein